MSLVVTTTSRPTPALWARAQRVAERCGCSAAPRRGSLARVMDAAEVDQAYVVGRQEDCLLGASGRVTVHAGLTLQRAASGRRHPLIRALTTSGSLERVVDATLGLAGDALHMTQVLGCEVWGYELSPVVFSLLEEGLPRLARGSTVAAAAARVRAQLGDAAEGLARLPDDAADVVFVAPMFAEPRPAPPGYAQFRQAAVADPMSSRLVAEALRVAPRLVLKVVSGAACPASLPGATRVAGKAVDYWVAQR